MHRYACVSESSPSVSPLHMYSPSWETPEDLRHPFTIALFALFLGTHQFPPTLDHDLFMSYSQHTSQCLAYNHYSNIHRINEMKHGITHVTILWLNFFCVCEYHDLIYKAETRHRHREQTCRHQEGEAWGEVMNWEIGIDIYTLLMLCIK